MTKMPPVVAATFSDASLHKPFSWLSEGDQADPLANDYADAMDAFRGIATCLQLIEMSNLDRELSGAADDEQIVPVLNMVDTGKLMRLAILVAGEWGNKFESKLQDVGAP